VIKEKLVQPHFVLEGSGISEEVLSMPGIYRQTLDNLVKTVESDIRTGLKKIILFGIPADKDDTGSSAFGEKSIIYKTVQKLKRTFGDDLCILCDLCLCEYTSHGHCGPLNEKGDVDNDRTIHILGNAAVSYAEAGADIIAPSDMMDGRVGMIRTMLDEKGFNDRIILSYAVKYASAFYGPFRDAAESAPSHGDRKGYQMDPRNAAEATREAELDIQEGADIIMVKPALPYLDIITLLKQNFTVPVAAYQVSGEYSMIKFAAHHDAIDEQKVIAESLTSITRAGAEIIITYFSRDIFSGNVEI
jgi:porphobilinogen synthase